MKPCPFCGMKLDPEDVDTVYPSGVGWKEDETELYRYYVSSREVPKEQWCYKVVCQEHYGGCNASITGDSKEEAIEKWNKRSESQSTTS